MVYVCVISLIVQFHKNNNSSHCIYDFSLWSTSFSIDSLRIFSIATVTCVFIVLPVNYQGQVIGHKEIAYESLEVFTILNVQEGSKWYGIF